MAAYSVQVLGVYLCM